MDYGITGENILCFGGEDWWYHHPHSKNHILKRLAKQNRVLFVNSLTLGLPAVSNPDFFLKIRRKLKSHLRWLRRAPEGLYVMTPFLLPLFGSPMVRRLNLFLLIIQLRVAMFLCRMRNPILWVCIPSAADVAEHLDAKLMVYHVSDKYDANQDSTLSRQVIRELDERLKRKADVVLFSGRKLFEESNLSKRCFLEQAVDFDHFATPASHTAEDMALIPDPVLCYFGAIDFIIDTPLIEEVARRRPKWNWVFIGLRSNLVQIQAPNVHFLGSKPYSDLPSYVRHADVFVLPWRQDNEFVSYGSAIKIREYLATGKPVVIAPLYEYLNTPGVRIYRTVDDFINAIEDALYRDCPAARQLRQSQVRDCTWEVRAQQVGVLFSSLLRGSTVEQAIGAAQLTAATETVVS